MGRWLVIIKQNNELLGWCGLKFLPDENEVDLGYRFFKKYWGNGYATESATAVLHYGFETLKLKCIIGRAAAANTASIRVLQKVGMHFEKNVGCHGDDGVQYVLEK